jgi:hypothetical protein
MGDNNEKTSINQQHLGLGAMTATTKMLTMRRRGGKCDFTNHDYNGLAAMA